LRPQTRRGKGTGTHGLAHVAVNLRGPRGPRKTRLRFVGPGRQYNNRAQALGHSWDGRLQAFDAACYIRLARTRSYANDIHAPAHHGWTGRFQPKILSAGSRVCVHLGPWAQTPPATWHEPRCQAGFTSVMDWDGSLEADARPPPTGTTMSAVTKKLVNPDMAHLAAPHISVEGENWRCWGSAGGDRHGATKGGIGHGAGGASSPTTKLLTNSRPKRWGSSFFKEDTKSRRLEMRWGPIGTAPYKFHAGQKPTAKTFCRETLIEEIHRKTLPKTRIWVVDAWSPRCAGRDLQGQSSTPMAAKMKSHLGACRVHEKTRRGISIQKNGASADQHRHRTTGGDDWADPQGFAETRIRGRNSIRGKIIFKARDGGGSDGQGSAKGSGARKFNTGGGASQQVQERC